MWAIWEISLAISFCTHKPGVPGPWRLRGEDSSQSGLHGESLSQTKEQRRESKCRTLQCLVIVVCVCVCVWRQQQDGKSLRKQYLQKNGNDITQSKRTVIAYNLAKYTMWSVTLGKQPLVTVCACSGEKRITGKLGTCLPRFLQCSSGQSEFPLYPFQAHGQWNPCSLSLH